MTKKIICYLLIALGLCCLFPIKADNPREKTSFSTSVKFPDEFIIAGIDIVNFQPSDVIKVLGKPSKEKSYLDTNGYGEQKRYIFIWAYKNIEIILSAWINKDEPKPEKPSVLDKVVIKSGSYKTYRGIGCGDSFEQLLEKYGKDRIVDKNWQVYDYGSYYIQFLVENKKIKRIEVGAISG